ncbi:hypothetical protein N9C06_04545 [Salibacteraceae bacterium]|jgi:hypothetical protein|nr:hypothetical protein [Salibacteraceae bacterium]
MDRILIKPKIRGSALALVSFLLAQALNAQEAPTIKEPSVTDEYTEKLESVSRVGVFPKNAPDGLYVFSVSGAYRFFGTYLQMSNPYLLNDAANEYQRKRTLLLADDSQLPNFTLNFSGRPAKNAFWNFDLYAFQLFEGSVNPTYGGQIPTAQRPSIWNPIIATTKPGQSMGLLLGISTNAAISTDVGNFGFTLGGTQWLSVSDLTLASFRGYNRFMLFERNPWDPVTSKIADRYDTFYGQGNINQDTRWGERAFQGFTVRANDLPGDISVLAMVGKTELNGGFDPLPNTSFGGKISRNFGSDLKASINSINNNVYLDSLGREQVGFNIVTGQVVYTKGEFGVDAEIGAGHYYSPVHDLDWGEAINVKLRFPLVTRKLPAELQVYRVSPSVVNNNAIYWNTAVIEATANDIPAGSVGSAAILQPFASPIVPIGLMTNNRQGVNLNVEYQLKDLKLSAANGISSEIEAITNLVTFGHPVNQLTRSRFWRWDFPTGVGPYARTADVFRDTYETMKLRDDSLGTAVNVKKFNVLELQAKYKTSLFHRTLFVNLLNRYSSVQKTLAPTVVVSEDAYLRHYTNELEFYYQVWQKVMLTGYLGYERILGNYDTELALETGKPRDQEGTGIGFGIDYDLGRNAGLYVRHRFFRFEDRSFTKDQFAGQETVVEIKVAF